MTHTHHSLLQPGICRRRRLCRRQGGCRRRQGQGSLSGKKGWGLARSDRAWAGRVLGEAFQALVAWKTKGACIPGVLGILAAHTEPCRSHISSSRRNSFGGRSRRSTSISIPQNRTIGGQPTLFLEGSQLTPEFTLTFCLYSMNADVWSR